MSSTGRLVLVERWNSPTSQNSLSSKIEQAPVSWTWHRSTLLQEKGPILEPDHVPLMFLKSNAYV